jgi:hypothetical protein
MVSGYRPSILSYRVYYIFKYKLTLFGLFCHKIYQNLAYKIIKYGNTFQNHICRNVQSTCFWLVLLMYRSFYIFNAIIFRDIKIWSFEIFKNLKLQRSLVPIFQMNFPGGTASFFPDPRKDAHTLFSPYHIIPTQKKLLPSTTNNCFYIDVSWHILVSRLLNHVIIDNLGFHITYVSKSMSVYVSMLYRCQSRSPCITIVVQYKYHTDGPMMGIASHNIDMVSEPGLLQHV